MDESVQFSGGQTVFHGCGCVTNFFQKYLENSAAFGQAIVREIRHVLLVTKFACVDSFLDAIIA